MLQVCSIASGSNGNCYYIGNDNEAILVDAGISARQILARMKHNNLNPVKIKAIFISHEHADHINGTRVLSKKLSIPVYVTSRTYMAMSQVQRPLSPRFFKPGDEISVCGFKINPFIKRHDAAEPCSFRVSSEGINIGIFTDIGSACENVIENARQCHVLFLETNYDDVMLWKGRYPWHLKRRIASEYGHLSNDQAYDIITKNPCSQLHTLLLSHLSAENNTPEKAYERFTDLCNKIKVHITSRYAPGEVIDV